MNIRIAMPSCLFFLSKSILPKFGTNEFSWIESALQFSLKDDADETDKLLFIL